MPKFTYKGQNSEGEKVTETVEAEDRFLVYDIARDNGHTISSVSEAAGFSFEKLMKMEKLNELFGRIKSDELVLMTRNLSSMLTAGLALTRALSVLERQSKNQKLISVLSSVRDRISKGEPFNQILSKYPKVFDDLYVSMVRAGEESGQLAESLQTLSVQMERSSSLKKRIKGAMIYPAVIITIMIIIGILMMLFVMPSITETFLKLELDLPPTTRALIATSTFLNEHTLLTIASMIGSVFGFLYFLKTSIGKKIFHYLVVRIPVIGTMVKETNAARTARTLSSLLKAGVDVISALKITKDVVQNIYYRRVIDEAAAQVEKGSPLSESFIAHEELYPVLVGEMIAVGEETGNISNMMGELAIFYENEVEQKTKDLSTIIEPMLMVVIGGGVGFFALAMITPIYSISDSIG